MAEEQKIAVDQHQETKPETGSPATAAETPAQTKPHEETSVPAESKPTEETKPAEANEAVKAEDKEEVVPVEEGYLVYKAQGLSFPKNLIASKEFLFFGSDAVESKVLAHYRKTEKSAEIAHANIAWASDTGKGLLFVGDRKAPTSVINLADATDPEVDSSHKFHLTSKGNRHTFKAANATERDNWVSQLKLKIAEAKELADTVTMSETYKATLESLKSAPVTKKEEKAVDTQKGDAVEANPAEVAAVVEEAPKEAESKEDAKKEEPKTDDSKRRSASRKRTSFFNFGKKETEAKSSENAVTETPGDSHKVEGAKNEEPSADAAHKVTTEEAPKPVEETSAAEAEEKSAESLKDKPAAVKRNSFFGVFSKKEKKTPELKPTEPPEAHKDGEAVEAAPVIPPVEATTPLAVDVNNSASTPASTSDAAAAASPAPESKKESKEKRKTSLPFAFGKRDKSPTPVEGEKAKESAFSKLRNTIRGKSPKPSDKNAEETSKEEGAKEEPDKKDDPTEPEPENKPENAAAPAPTVIAAA